MSINGFSFSPAALPAPIPSGSKAAPSSKSLKRMSGSDCLKILALCPDLTKIDLELQPQEYSLKGEKS